MILHVKRLSSSFDRNLIILIIRSTTLSRFFLVYALNFLSAVMIFQYFLLRMRVSSDNEFSYDVISFCCFVVYFANLSFVPILCPESFTPHSKLILSVNFTSICLLLHKNNLRFQIELILKPNLPFLSLPIIEEFQYFSLESL